MPTIYLHIGAPKTGTSSLQHAFARSADELRKEGVLYPKSCRFGDAHHVLVCDLIDKYQPNPMPDAWYGDYPRGQAWGALRQELLECGDSVESVVLSSELFFGQTQSLPRMLGDIERALEGFAVKVVVYLRPQDQMYSSFYNQDVKGMRQWTGSAYEFYETHQIFRKDYYEVVSAWAEAFGSDSIIVRPFESSQLAGEDIVSDFCDMLGIAPLPAASGGGGRNDGLGPNQLYIKRCMNTVGFDKGRNDEVLSWIVRLCPEPLRSGVLYVNRGVYKRYCKDWGEVNHRLAKEYLNREQLFLHQFPRAGDLELFEINSEVLQQFVRRLLQQRDKKAYSTVKVLLHRTAMLVISEQCLWDHFSAAELAQLIGGCQAAG